MNICEMLSVFDCVVRRLHYHYYNKYLTKVAGSIMKMLNMFCVVLRCAHAAKKKMV